MKKSESGQYEIVDYKISQAQVAKEIWVSGNITMLMADFGMITLAHQPVLAWNWEAGEMNFAVDESVELTGLKEGQNVDFLVENKGGDFVLKRLKKSEGK